MLEEANVQIWRAHTEEQRRRQEAQRLTSVVRAIDDLLFQLEDLNLQGVDRVPARLRSRAVAILEVVPEPRAQAEAPELRVRYRVVPMMDVLFRAQEVLFRLRDPDRPDDEEEDEELGA